jgi:putative phosphoesterase
MNLKRIALFSDIHSNLLALENVIKDIENNNIQEIYCLGDLVGYGPRPNEVIELLRELKIPTIMGNYDKGIGFEKDDCGCAYTSWEEIETGKESIEWTTRNTSQGNKEFLRNLLKKIELEINGKRILLVHGSPRRINEYLYEDRPEKSVRRMLNSLNVDILGCGHTHLHYFKIVNGVYIVNPGSVGKPKDGDPRSSYASIDMGKEVEVNFRRVEYPVEKVAEEIIQVGLPKVFAEALRGAGA